MPMQQVFAALSRLAPTELTVTMIGETGTGKDVLAHAIHERSARAEGPFVVFDCGAVAHNLAESELFGYERGAFTGALAAHAGGVRKSATAERCSWTRSANCRSSCSRACCALWRTGPCNGSAARAIDPIDLRIIAATHRDLPARVADKLFREDLFFRITAAIIPVPALRQRIEDLSLLVPALLADLGRPELEVSAETYAVLGCHRWPGNVRELKNVLASASAFVKENTLEPRHLLFLAPTEPAKIAHLRLGGQTLASLERVAIGQTLATHGGDHEQTAATLGITPAALLEKLESLRED